MRTHKFGEPDITRREISAQNSAVHGLKLEIVGFMLLLQMWKILMRNEIPETNSKASHSDNILALTLLTRPWSGYHFFLRWTELLRMVHK